MATRPYQVVIWGASGFTGRLVCEHLSKDYKGKVSWAMAGRSQAKLESIRADLAEKYGAEISEVPILLGSLEDQASLDTIASQTDVIISTAGPFAKHGTPVVDAAVRESSHYVDITGEVPWVKNLIDKYHEEATKKNVRIVNCCGYDSIPSDLGALLVVDHFKSTLGTLPVRVVSAVAESRAGISGGTIATGMYQLAQAAGSKGTQEDSSSTYALIPTGAQRGNDKDAWWTEFCAPLGKYLAPFVMQVCNTRIVQRSNYLLNWGGPEFSYREGVVASGSTSAKGVALATIAVAAAFSRPWLHPLLREGKDGSIVIGEVGDKNRDPGYWGTSRMVLEAALCLALQQKQLDADPVLVKGGVITSASAMGMHLIDRLKNSAGLTFEITEGHLLKDQLEVVKVKTPEGGTRYTIKPLTSELTFDKGLFVFVRAVQLLTHQNKDIIVVGLAGPSGAGKTAFSRKLQNLIPGCAILSMDNYNDGSKVIDGNFDDPRITDYETLLANLIDLKSGKSTQSPIYDFKESRRVGYSTVEVPESRVVILEGIYALSHRLRPYLDLRVSITGGVHFDLVKRVLRDIDRSAQAPEEIIQQVSDTVYPMYKAFIEPDLKAAHLRIHNPFNPFSGFMSPTYILKSARPVSVTSIELVLGADHVKRTESETYDIYLVPPGEDPETCQSWLRMRYRDGRYNLMFEEWVVEGHFIISPRVTFEVPVRILGGLMALGYEIGTIMQRTTESFCSQDGKVTVKLDHIVGMTQCFVQVQSKDRAAVAAVGTALGLDGSYIPHSYIEVVQLENLTQSFQTVTEDLRKRFAVNGEPLIDEQMVGSFSRGSSPAMGSFSRTIGFHMTSPTAASREGRGGAGGRGAAGGLLGSQEGTSDQPLLSSSAPIAVRPGSSLLAQRSGLLSQKIQAAGGGSNSGGAGGLLVSGAQQIGGNVAGSNAGGARASSTGGSSTPDCARGSRPASPGNAEGQMRKLVQTQSLLTSQMEELTLQLSLAQQRGTLGGGGGYGNQTGQLASLSSSWERWVTPVACASGGVLVGAALAVLFLNGSSSRS